MILDQLALMQGVWSAKDEKRISQKLADVIFNLVSNVSYLSPNGRKVCDYIIFLAEVTSLCDMDFEYHEIARLWEHLGKSISSAIMVANRLGNE